MSVRSFFDTNILVYTDDLASPDKRALALDLFDRHQRGKTGVVSIQVLQEYFVASTKKFRLDPVDVRKKVEIAAGFDVAIPEVSDVLAAIDLHHLHKFSFWDALILRMASQTGCKVIYSEDLQDTREIGGLKIVNPFR